MDDFEDRGAVYRVNWSVTPEGVKIEDGAEARRLYSPETGATFIRLERGDFDHRIDRWHETTQQATLAVAAEIGALATTLLAVSKQIQKEGAA